MTVNVLKIGATQDVFHKAGVKRVSRNALEVLGQGISEAIDVIAGDVATAYPGRLVESHHVVNVSRVKGGYAIVLVLPDSDDISLDDLVAGEPMDEHTSFEEEAAEGMRAIQKMDGD